ncbi:hypothetical protein NMY22_g7964 [Coprinellus aureogranulatus]|nr:hypothetical protein NMY22_g7964 [Coprinellus aureogranulatus]
MHRPHLEPRQVGWTIQGEGLSSCKVYPNFCLDLDSPNRNRIQSNDLRRGWLQRRVCEEVINGMDSGGKTLGEMKHRRTSGTSDVLDFFSTNQWYQKAAHLLPHLPRARPTSGPMDFCQEMDVVSHLHSWVSSVGKRKFRNARNCLDCKDHVSGDLFLCQTDSRWKYNVLRSTNNPLKRRASCFDRIVLSAPQALDERARIVGSLVKTIGSRTRRGYRGAGRESKRFVGPTERDRLVVRLLARGHLDRFSNEQVWAHFSREPALFGLSGALRGRVEKKERVVDQDFQDSHLPRPPYVYFASEFEANSAQTKRTISPELTTRQSAILKRMSGASRFRSGVRMSVTERLLRHSQSSPTGGTSRDGEIIAREADFDFVGRVLASLDPSLIPLGLDERIVAQRRDAAMKSIVDLSTINMTLHTEHSSPLVQGYEARYFPMLLERWPGVIKWLEFLLVYTHATVPAAVDTIIHLCCDILDTIVRSSADNVYKEELATADSTVDLIYFLLRQKEVQSPHRYHFIVPLQARRGEGRCKIVKLFQTSLQTDAGWKAMESRLALVNRRTRDSIVHSLVTRAKEMVRRNPSFTISVLDTLHSLVWAVGRITSNNCIWNAFQRAGFLPTFAAALAELGMLAMGSRVTDQQCWASIGKSVAMFSFCAHNRPAVIDLVAEGQFFGIVSLCFEHDPSPVDLLNGLDNVIPYFYLAKAYESASPMRTLAHVFKAHTGRFTTSPRAAKIHEEYTRFIEYVQMTHDGRRAISPNMCSNMKHWWSKGTFHTDKSTDGDRVCTRCHSVVYCSAECQRADWEFHLGECRALKEQYRALKSKGAWVSASTRKEQLKFLDTVTNQEVPSPTDLKKRTLMFMTCDEPVPPLHCTPPASRYGTSISTFEFFATRPDRMVSQRWIQDMEASPGTRALVEGAFRLHHGYSMLVLARFSYSPKAPQPTRYSVLNAIFCPILTSQLPNLTET